MDSFSLRPFVRYKYMHEYVKAHAASQCRKNSITSAKNFVSNMPVNEQNDIIGGEKKAQEYSFLADESCHIVGKEQLSIDVRFFEEERIVIREEFLGFVKLVAMDAKSIASAIDNFIRNVTLDPEKENFDEHSGNFIAEAEEVADALEIDLSMPRIA
ncbi:hypothetical protein KGM_213459 [Danaus plexippus plexippus]|uniref:Uncharacterized protein n=1 Tax=Danaus plexippus plexippus TaxID=278856 RepID=A0A212FBY1_DANPL|nr:hypothetical protein KGM_213459 [Danaus plexippus plexippus]